MLGVIMIESEGGHGEARKRGSNAAITKVHGSGGTGGTMHAASILIAILTIVTRLRLCLLSARLETGPALLKRRRARAPIHLGLASPVLEDRRLVVRREVVLHIPVQHLPVAASLLNYGSEFSGPALLEIGNVGNMYCPSLVIDLAGMCNQPTSSIGESASIAIRRVRSIRHPYG